MPDKTPFSKISSSYQRLRASNKFSVVLVCLFVSVVFWLLITLSKVYSGQIIFPVKYVNLPDRRMVLNDLPTSIQVSVKTSGFEILLHRFSGKEDSIVFDMEANLQRAKEVNKDVIAVSSRSLTSDLNEKLGSDYNITAFVPDSIVFSFVNRGKKKVPVHLDAKTTFEKQFDATGPPVILPDSVTISGPDTVILKMQYVETVPLVHSNLKAPLTATVKLKRDSLVTVNPDQVTVTIPVEKFTEGTTEVPVHIINLKSGYTLKTFPDKVTIHYLVPLSRFNNINPSMFDAVADATELPNSDLQQIKINIISQGMVKAPVAMPDKVDYILRKK